MAWEIQTQEPREWETEEQVLQKKLVIGSEEIDVSRMSAREVVDLIIQKAREKGWSRIIVTIDGEPVSREEFEQKFASARIITVLRKDVAA